MGQRVGVALSHSQIPLEPVPISPCRVKPLALMIPASLEKGIERVESLLKPVSRAL